MGYRPALFGAQPAGINAAAAGVANYDLAMLAQVLVGEAVDLIERMVS